MTSTTSFTASPASPASRAAPIAAQRAAEVDAANEASAVGSARATGPSILTAGTWLALAGGALAVVSVAGVAVGVRRSGPQRQTPGRATRLAACGAALLASSVLADSAMEHYRGSYRKKAMWVAPPAAAITLTAAVAMALSSRLMTVKSAVFGTEVDPISRTPDPYGRRSSLCPRPAPRTRRHFANR